MIYVNNELNIINHIQNPYIHFFYKNSFNVKNARS